MAWVSRCGLDGAGGQNLENCFEVDYPDGFFFKLLVRLQDLCVSVQYHCVSVCCLAGVGGNQILTKSILRHQNLD